MLSHRTIQAGWTPAWARGWGAGRPGCQGGTWRHSLRGMFRDGPRMAPSGGAAPHGPSGSAETPAQRTASLFHGQGHKGQSRARRCRSMAWASDLGEGGLGHCPLAQAPRGQPDPGHPLALQPKPSAQSSRAPDELAGRGGPWHQQSSQPSAVVGCKWLSSTCGSPPSSLLPDHLPASSCRLTFQPPRTPGPRGPLRGREDRGSGCQAPP